MAMPVVALVLQTLARCDNGCSDLVNEAKDWVQVSQSTTNDPASRGNTGSGFGAPSSALTLTILKNNVPAWADLAGSKLKNPPLEVDGIPTFIPSAQVAVGSEVVFHCPSSAADVCDAWVFFYSCQQSCDISFQGGVPSQLQGDGWQHTNCAPRFLTGVPSGFSHQMRSYRTKVKPGQSVAFTTMAKSEFLAFGLDKDGVDCEKLTTPLGCVSAPFDACTWSPVGECLPTRCRRGGQGPPPPCTECPWEGIERRPPVHGPF